MTSKSCGGLLEGRDDSDDGGLVNDNDDDGTDDSDDNDDDGTDDSDDIDRNDDEGVLMVCREGYRSVYPPPLSYVALYHATPPTVMHPMFSPRP